MFAGKVICCYYYVRMTTNTVVIEAVFFQDKAAKIMEKQLEISLKIIKNC